MTTVKLVCPCGTKFAFEADETLTLASGVIACPACGADAAPAANAQLLAGRSAAGQEASASTSPVRVRLSLNKAADEAPDSGAGEPAEASGEGAHTDAEEAERPVRPDFSRGRPLTKSERQIRRNRELANRRRPYVFATVLLLLGLAGFWGWYRFSGSRPKVVMNETYDRKYRPLMARLVDENELLLVRNREISLLAVPGGAAKWEKSFGSITNFDDGEPLHIEAEYRVERANPEIRVRSNSFWVVWPDHVLQLDRASGKTLVSVELKDGHPEILMGDRALLLEQQATKAGHRTFELHPYDGGERRAFEVPLVQNERLPEVVPDGLSMVTVQTRLLEEKIITRKLSTGPKVMTAAGIEKSVDQNVDKILNDNLTAANSLRAATQIAREWQRLDDAGPDEITEDHSRYQVELRRLGNDGSTSWTGEVIGPPQYFPLPTVDVVAGERNFRVIGKNGSEKWEAALSYPLSYRGIVSAQFFQPDFRRHGNLGSFDDRHGLRYHFPFVEHDGRLYSFDRGVLSAFDLASGTVKWRITSVGIRKIMFDQRGSLYACTTMTSPQALNTSDGEPEEGNHALMKVDPTDGRVLWTTPHLGTDIFMEGDFVYSQWLGQNDLDAAAMMAAGGRGSSISCAFTRIDPRKGEIIWRLDYKGNPDTINTRGNAILIQFTRRLELVNFFSL